MFYVSLTITTKRKYIVDAWERKGKESKHTIAENQITKEENEREKEATAVRTTRNKSTKYQ